MKKSTETINSTEHKLDKNCCVCKHCDGSDCCECCECYCENCCECCSDCECNCDCEKCGKCCSKTCSCMLKCMGAVCKCIFSDFCLGLCNICCDILGGLTDD